MKERNELNQLWDDLKSDAWSGPVPNVRPVSRPRRRARMRGSMIAAITLCATAWTAAVGIASEAGERAAEQVFARLTFRYMLVTGDSLTISGENMDINADGLVLAYEDTVDLNLAIDSDDAFTETGLFAEDGTLKIAGQDLSIAGDVSTIIVKEGATLSFDFAIARTPSPDVNEDGFVDAEDLSALLRDYGAECACPADANADGVVDAEDIRYVVTRFTQYVSD